MNFNGIRMHFVGIGGVGMSGLAEMFFELGAQVTGSDKNSSAQTDYLKSKGISIFIGHDEKYAVGSDVVVFSSAINKSNPEIQWALKSKIPLIPRAEALAELMRLKRGIAIAGSHGKTTTTSFISHIFLEAKLNPTVVVGGRLKAINSNALLGQGEWLIAEADESDGSFQKLNPEIALITNIDHDHLDYYKTLDYLYESFYEFALKIPFYGYLLFWGDDVRLRHLFERFPKRFFTYGFSQENDYVILNKETDSEIYFAGKYLGTFKSPLKGRHNILNSAASLIIAYRAGIDLKQSSYYLLKFNGVERRLHYLATKYDIEFYTDYAHHPTEIICTLEAFREMFSTRRLVLIFQPHRYTRTEFCWNDFLKCFNNSDITIIIDIYSAGENPIMDITSERLVKEINSPSVTYISNELLTNNLKNIIKPHDLVVFMGAGDIFRIGKEFIERF